MNISEISAENFKNFKQLDISFNSGVNLFVGSNGCGKTSMLEIISVALGGFFASQEQKMQRMIEFNEIKITNGKREDHTTVSASAKVFDGSWSRTIKRDTKTNDKAGVKIASDYGKVFFDALDLSDDQTIAPLISYYSTLRLFKDSYQSDKQKYDAANGRRNGYLQCLKENAIKPVLNEWLGNAVTRRATMQIKGIAHSDLILENVETAIRKALIECMSLDEAISLKIYQDPDFGNELFINYDNDHNLPLTYYSDGFRNLMYLVIDLVWRASQLNPWLTLDKISSQVTGVVAIDEIDLHLHPKWQAKAIGLLQSLFPKVQFFITTHSPTVVANFENGTLYIIENNTIDQYTSEYFGKKINIVLRDVLGANDRHIPTQNKLNTLFKYIEDNNAPLYIPLLNELTQLLGEDDADIAKAHVLIDWNNVTM